MNYYINQEVLFQRHLLKDSGNMMHLQPVLNHIAAVPLLT